MSLLGTYLTLLAASLMVLAPLLIPVMVSAYHACTDWRRADEPIRPIITRAAPTFA